MTTYLKAMTLLLVVGEDRKHYLWSKWCLERREGLADSRQLKAVSNVAVPVLGALTCKLRHNIDARTATCAKEREKENQVMR